MVELEFGDDGLCGGRKTEETGDKCSEQQKLQLIDVTRLGSGRRAISPLLHRPLLSSHGLNECRRLCYDCTRVESMCFDGIFFVNSCFNGVNYIHETTSECCKCTQADMEW